ncbi:MAG TPA: arsenite methyltransferase [Candidatus Bathyarchaeia archaeon]|nr:arsenite methyltransferase [Candidatus Bathyarchaeia archaeon]
MNKNKDDEAIRTAVREGYAQVARGGGSCCGPASGPNTCCGTSQADLLAEQIGYSEQELAALPEGANLGLSCGNPTAIAGLSAGEVVLDLGSGAGFDVFIAGRKVGATGRVIGVDMTPEMVAKARENTAGYRARAGLDNVEFRLGEIEHLPVADGSVDVIISNCVINLSPDKPQVWREMYRVLKPGGRTAISDLALLQPLPEAVRGMVEALVGCVAGAALVSDVERMAREVGFKDVRLEQKTGFVEAMVDANDPLYRKILEHLPEEARPGDFATSLYITAHK